MLPLTTTTLGVKAAGAVTLDAQRRRVHAPAGAARGPYGAVVTPVDASSLPPEQRDAALQLRRVSIRLQPDAWPITAGDQLEGPGGELYDVDGAVLRDDLAGLEHVAVNAHRLEVPA